MRSVSKDIRWTEHELTLIDEARGTQTFSEFVREAALEKAIETTDYAGNSK